MSDETIDSIDDFLAAHRAERAVQRQQAYDELRLATGDDWHPHLMTPEQIQSYAAVQAHLLGRDEAAKARLRAQTTKAALKARSRARDDRAAEIQALQAAGLSIPQTAIRLGLSTRTVSRLRKKS